MRSFSWPSLCALFVLACSARPQLELGNECELTTQCADPLVCRLGYCRVECRQNRDCRVGLVCLQDDDGLRACELPAQDQCTLTSSCVSPLVCLMGHCSEACMTDVDCPAGARCLHDDAGVGIGCRDDSTMQCELNSDCLAPLICAPDRLCREQCHTNRDCRDGLVCDLSMTISVCVPPQADAGIDASSSDASTDVGHDASSANDADVDAAVLMTGPAPIPLLVAGQEHTCATLSGQLRCWGAGTEGEIGDGAFTDRHTTTPLTLASVTMLAAGALHACAYSTTSGLRCWGQGTSGQIGDAGMVARGVPTAVSGALVPTWISAGSSHTCAVVAGAVQCWGSNGSGELGDGTMTPRNTPTPTIPLAGTAIEVAARGSSTCARLSDGRVQCWGDDRGGQLGVDIGGAMISMTPLLVAGVSNAEEIVLGSQHACARRTDGVVLCWGNDGIGQLGDGGTGARVTPAPTSAMPPALELAAAGDHTCARTIDGDVYCWGDNGLGQCGSDPLASPTSGTIRNPARVIGVSNATELTTGDNHSCARTATGFTCWGENNRGQLGDGGTTSHYMPGVVGWP